MNSKLILVPVTLAAGSGAAVVVASRLAQDLEATLVFLHVIKPGSEPTEEFVTLRKLQLLTERWQVATPVQFEVGAGQPADVIVQKATELGVDTIVMTTHGYRGWFRWLHRFTARQVLRRVACPVWLVSPCEEEEAAVTLSVVTPTSEINFSQPWRPTISNTLPSLLMTISAPEKLAR